MNFRTTLIAITFVCFTCLVSACPKTAPSGGAGKPGTTTATTPGAAHTGDGGSSLATGAAATWPTDYMPSSLPQYPGSTLTSSQLGQTEGTKRTTAVSMFTTDSADKVYAFYEAKAKASGWVQLPSTEAEGTRSDHYTSENGKTIFNLMCQPGEGGTQIALMVGASYMNGDKGSGEEDGGTSPPGEGGSGEAGVDGGEEEPVATISGKLPDSFPSQVLKPYPGGEIITAVTQGGSNVLSLTTQDSVTQITDFYLKHFTGRGWAKGDDIDMGGARMIAFNSSAGEISFTCTDGEIERAITLVMEPMAGASGGSGGDGGSGGSEGSAGGGEPSEPGATISEGKLPIGFPTNILPLYPGGTIDAAAINGNDYTLLQLSSDSPDQVVKHYDKLFREAGWNKESSVDISGTYYGGWNKNGDQIDMTATERENGKAFMSLVYTDN